MYKEFRNIYNDPPYTINSEYLVYENNMTGNISFLSTS